MLARPSSSKPRPDTYQRRALIVSLILVGWMFLIAARLVNLQVYRHDDLLDRARQQQQRGGKTVARRGEVLDRQGRELARSIDTESFYFEGDLAKTVDLEKGVDCLAEALNVDKTALRERFTAAKNANKKFVWIARRLTEEDAARVRGLNLPWLKSQAEPKRYYPNDGLAAHILGFVNIDEDGLGGIEQYYNDRIKGEPGRLYETRDARDRTFDSYEVRPHPGQTVVLTIDQTAQYRMEQAVQAALDLTKAKSATAIALDPRTGEILALASAPSFNPNNLQAALPEARRNSALQTTYEPGSTFKVVAYSAALEKGLVKPDDKIDCQMGAITIAKRVVHDHHPFGMLTIANALEQSSNVAAIKLGLMVGNESMFDYIKRFGFGSRSGIDLPGESVGILHALKRWTPSSIGSVAMGQEVSVTPIQMAAAYAAIANNGVKVTPHLVKEIRSPDGAVVFQAKPEARVVLKPETAMALRGMLEGVTVRGTAKLAQLDGYRAAGKTGTAQKIDPATRTYSKTKFIGSFVGFAPVSNPAIVIIVVIDEPAGAYHGGDVAAPVFQQIAEQILPYLNVMPDTHFVAEPELIAKRTPTPAAKEIEPELLSSEQRQATLPRVTSRDAKADMREVVYAASTRRGALMPDLRGQSVRDVARLCAQLGLKLEAHGDGRALRQAPDPGMEIVTGQHVRVEFERRN
jgi:cell division protein FtsI (penicillin-binding protein 3)